MQCISLFKHQQEQEPEHGSLRIRAHLSWRTGKHLHVLHVLLSPMVGWNEVCICNPASKILLRILSNKRNNWVLALGSGCSGSLILILNHRHV